MLQNYYITKAVNNNVILRSSAILERHRITVSVRTELLGSLNGIPTFLKAYVSG